MAPRATFKGFLRLSLVSVPVKAFTATQTGGEIRLNQLHKECNNRIQYQKVCPMHGPVQTSEIVSGYEYAKDQYVKIDPAEVQKLRKQSDKTVNIEGFVSPDEVEPRFYSGRTYYFLPDGSPGQKPYQLLYQAMVDDELFAIGKAVLSGREHVVVIRPIDGVLGMNLLTYASKVKPVHEFSSEIEETEVTEAEVNLTKTLIQASLLNNFDIEAYKDEYSEQLNQIIEAKIAGEEVVAVPDQEEPKVINLMEALKASVESLTQEGESEPAPAKKKASKRKSKTKRAPSAKTSKKKTAKKKRQTG